jgi:signal transduction histidine kinase
MILELSESVRSLLHPPLLDEAGIASAVRWYVEGFGARSNIDVSLEFPPNIRRIREGTTSTWAELKYSEHLIIGHRACGL